MKIKISGWSIMPCQEEVADCEECPSHMCEQTTVFIARTTIGYYLKLFLMKIIHDYIEVENLEAEENEDYDEDDCERF